MSFILVAGGCSYFGEEQDEQGYKCDTCRMNISETKHIPRMLLLANFFHVFDRRLFVMEVNEYYLKESRIYLIYTS